ncbi:MAG: response regulator transcription factor [Pseudomonadota bacterium]
MKHILVIDDDERICALMARLLRRAHYEVSIAHSAYEAEQAARYFIFDAIITDVMMPEVSGNELAHKIRNAETFFHKYIPIMMVSAGVETHQRIEGIKQGADDYLIKPFEPDELLVRIAALLRRAEHSRDYSALPQNKNAREIILGDYRLNLVDTLLSYQDQDIALSQSEAEALAFLMKNKNIPIQRHEMTLKFFPEAAHNPHSRAIDVMIARLRRKIETLTGEAAPIITRRGEGYMWQQ